MVRVAASCANPQTGQAEAVRILLDSKANIRSRAEGLTAWLLASSLATVPDADALATLRLLLQHKADVEDRDLQGNTALLLACRRGLVSRAEFLIKEAKADVLCVN